MLTACGSRIVIPDKQAERCPVLFPDYTGVTFPVNIAPPNCRIMEEGDVFQVEIGTDNRLYYQRKSKSPDIRIPLDTWRLLTKENIYADDKLFATLDTTSRRLFLGEDKYCLLTDTVGFVSKLPHELVESFSSTLEEISSADLILHVVDLSDPFYKKNIEITNQILDNLHATENRITILNKSDLCTKPVKLEINQVLFSIKKKENIEKLKEIIRTALY